MKVLVIGDIHGRDVWKEIVMNNTFDKVVFIGDYLDSREDISIENQISNFLEIVVYKKSNMDKVALLVGNHDFHYLPFVENKYTGFKYETYNAVTGTIHQLISDDILQASVQIDDYLFTHAGVSTDWYEKLEHKDVSSVMNTLNDYMKYKPLIYDFTMGVTWDIYGDDISQTPIWIRPYSLQKCYLKPYIHVVGHTHYDEVKITENVIFTDALPKYVIIDTLNKSYDTRYI